MEPRNRIAQARMDAGLSPKELAAKLNVDVGTVSNWEAGRRQLTLERLKEISVLLGVGVTYLLGLNEQVSNTEPVSKELLPVLHRTPVWIKNYGWALVNAVQQVFMFTDGCTLSFEAIQEPVYITPPAFALGLHGIGTPLDINGILNRDRVWVEPISEDPTLAAELRGWYRPHGKILVENEYGNRFYMDTCGAKWLAFENCIVGRDGNNIPD